VIRKKNCAFQWRKKKEKKRILHSEASLFMVERKYSIPIRGKKVEVPWGEYLVHKDARRTSAMLKGKGVNRERGCSLRKKGAKSPARPLAEERIGGRTSEKEIL